MLATVPVEPPSAIVVESQMDDPFRAYIESYPDLFRFKDIRCNNLNGNKRRIACVIKMRWVMDRVDYHARITGTLYRGECKTEVIYEDGSGEETIVDKKTRRLWCYRFRVDGV